MNKNNWEINRIGLINFWYYDDEEFELVDGRLLLRGNNGAGKSLTMQSFIPLLLDGNLRPERLDPFGSRDKKIKNYLLDENDSREERTGYLYMEFKRKNINEYITIGVGLQAKIHQNVSSWFFILKGEKRVGKDFLLYKKSGDIKIPLSKIELRNRLESCDELIDSSNHYLKRINNIFFGFQSEEEYRELLELLIQIRSPKLSNSFKPTKMIEILNNSLTTLSSEDLHTISESIKKMDELKANLQELAFKISSGEKILRVFTAYNEEIILEKMKTFFNVSQEFKELKKGIKGSEETVEKINREISNIEKKLDQLNNELSNIQQEKISLEKNNSTKLKEEFELLKIDFKKNEEILIEKNETFEKSKGNLNKKNITLKEENKNIELFKYQIDKFLKEMEDEIDIEEFSEFLLFKEELLKDIEKEYDFSFHQDEIKKYTKNLEKAKTILQELEYLENLYSKALETLEKKENDLNFADKTKEKYEIQVAEIKEELIEKIYSWHDKNQYLKLSQPQFKTLLTKIHNFNKESQFEEIKNQIVPIYETLEKEFKKLKFKIENNYIALENSVEELKLKLYNLENTKEIEPDRTQNIIDNRTTLKNLDIPFIEFYKCVDFPDNITEQQRNNIEEALYNMGILDALIVEPKYRERVLRLNEGVCDKYIFSTQKKIRVDFENILKNDKAEINFENSTFIEKDGNYKLGIIEGTITKNYNNYFIGIEARKEFRKKKINLLKEEITLYCEKMAIEKNKEKELIEKIDSLELEKNSFPKGEDILTAFQLLTRSEMEYDIAKNEFEKQREFTEQEEIKKEKKKNEAFLFCRDLKISPKLEEVELKLVSIKEYISIFNELRNIHSKYLNSIVNSKSIKLDIEELEDRKESLFIDIKRLENIEDKISLRLKSIEEQMNMSDYIEIKEKLDYCIKRYNEIPDEKLILSNKGIELKMKKENLQTSLIENYEKQKFLNEKLKFVKEGLIEEARLNYSTHSSILLESIEVLESIVENILKNSKVSKNRKELETDFYSTFHENKSTLTLYKLSLETLFRENNENIYNISNERFDIKCKLNGNTLTFNKLIEYLKEHEKGLNNLFTSNDEELFKEILSNTISKKIKLLISQGKEWIQKMNKIMKETDSGSGISFSLDWKNKSANSEEELDTNQLVTLLGRDVQVMKDEDFEKLSNHFRSKINEARIKYQNSLNILTFEQIIKEVLDYRQWFQFQLYYQKTGEKKEVLTDSRFSTFSGGEKAMAMYIPLFAAAAAKYKGARNDAPKIIALDEAFAGIDNENIEKLLSMMVTLDFNFILTSQALNGAYNSLPGLSTYHLARFNNNKFVTTLRFRWNGKRQEKLFNNGDSNAY